MSYKQRSGIASLITSILVTVPYLIYIFDRYQNETLTMSGELQFWASALLLMLPIRIVAEILIRIITAIMYAIVTGKEETMMEDERDKLIELKSERNSMYGFFLGFIIAMIIMTTNPSISVMFIILVFSGFFSEIVSILSQMYYYSKGV